MSTSPRYVFIVGVPRSGTTLVAAELGARYEVEALPETPWISGSYGETSLRHLVRHLAMHPQGLASQFDTTRASLQDWLRETLDSLLVRSGVDPRSNTILFKTPDDIRHARWLLDTFPEAMLVHVVRHPAPTVLSTRRAADDHWSGRINGFGHASFTRCLERWVRWNEEAELARAQAPERVTTLRFEDLCAAPDATLRDLARVLGLSARPAREHPWRVAEQGGAGGGSLRILREPTTADPVLLPWALAAWMSRRAITTMERYEYEIRRSPTIGLRRTARLLTEDVRRAVRYRLDHVRGQV